MTDKQVIKLLDKYRQAPDDIELAIEKIEQWQDIDGAVAAGEVERLKKRVVELQKLIVSVERAVEKLPKSQRDIIRLRGEGTSWWGVAQIIRYSVRSCQMNYGKALRVLANSKELMKYASEIESGDIDSVRG